MMLAWRQRNLLESATSFHRLKALLRSPIALLPRFNQTCARRGRGGRGKGYGGRGEGLVDQFDFPSMVATGHTMSRWKKIDARKLGIKLSMIPESPQFVLGLLKKDGFEAYLVGGCVRDILMNKVPKDYDVVTTANLQQIRRKFRRAQIIGKRFPICQVPVKGSVVEVASFEKVAKGGQKKEGSLSQLPMSHGEMDAILWKDCLCRDFTVNGLFFDPFACKIYDFCDGMTDLRSLKLRTLVPAQVSFKEDRARILRGLRIAARLGLSISNDTEIAMLNLSSSIKDLDKGRLMMEMNYMLSYGAAAPSLSLLQRFKLLEILLPFQAAYLSQPSTDYHPRDSKMLMELFFNLDKVVACDRPCTCSLWICVLVFHMALVIDPQDALVVWTFCSALYFGSWTEAVKVARGHAKEHVNFAPETLKANTDVSDEELAKRVSEFASRVQDSIDALTNSDCLLEAMARYPNSTCSRLVFVSKKAGCNAAQIFDVLVENIEGKKEKRESYEINYQLLGEGHIPETRFSLGKVIMDTLSGAVTKVEKEVDVAKYWECPADQETEPNEVEENQYLALEAIGMKGSTGKGNAHRTPLLEGETQVQVQVRGIKKKRKLSKKAHIVAMGEDVIPIYQVPEKGWVLKERAVEDLKVVVKHLQSEQKIEEDEAGRKNSKEGLAEEFNKQLKEQKVPRGDSCLKEENANNKKEDKGEPRKRIQVKQQTCVRKHSNLKIANGKEQSEGMNVKKDVTLEEYSVVNNGEEEEPAGKVSRKLRLSSLF